MSNEELADTIRTKFKSLCHEHYEREIYSAAERDEELAELDRTTDADIIKCHEDMMNSLNSFARIRAAKAQKTRVPIDPERN